MRRINASLPFFTASALVLVISIFMVFVQITKLDTDNEAAIYGVMLILQTVVFAVPAGAFCYFRGYGYVIMLDIFKPRKNSIAVATLGSLLLILTSAVMKFGIFHFVYDASGYSLYGSSISIKTDSLWTGILMVLSLAIVPAVLEEFVFRGIIVYEYRHCGSVFAIIMSALTFTMIHFDLKQFFIFLALGAILAWIAFITRCVWICAAVHVVYNLYAIFIEKYVWMFSVNPDSDILFWLILVVLWFVCGFFFVNSAEKVMRYCADNGDPAPRPVKKINRKIAIFDSLTEKPFMIAFAIFIVAGIVNIFAG